MSISAQQVKELREKTGAGMMDCKKALQEANGDLETAVEWLRKKGLASASKKSSRIASDGLISIVVKDLKGAIIELNSETDFVSKNDKFQELAKYLANEFVSYDGECEDFKDSTLESSGKKVVEEISENIALIGENITLRRAKSLSVLDGVVTSYIHNAMAPGLGKIGVLIALETKADKHKANALGKQIAMHIAALKPESLSVEELDQSLVEKEKNVFREQAKASGKPDNVIEKMIEGRISKFYEQIVLLEQAFVIDGKTKVKDVLAEFGKENGNDIKIKEFTCFTLGEGIEKEESNFAEEVASMAKK